MEDFMTDKELFGWWLDNEPNKNKLPESSFETYAARFGFLAACEIKDKEIAIIQSRVKEANDEYNKQCDINEKLKEENRKMLQIIKDMKELPIVQESIKLKEQLEKAHKVIEFYAKDAHWQGEDGYTDKGYRVNRLCYEFAPYLDDSEEMFKEEDHGTLIPVIKCGKRARDYLKQLEQEKSYEDR